MTANWRKYITPIIVTALTLGDTILFFISPLVLTKTLSLGVIALAIYYFITFRPDKEIIEKLKSQKSNLHKFSILSFKFIYRSTNISYLFLLGLGLLAYSGMEALPRSEWFSNYTNYILAITLVSGVVAFWLNREKLQTTIDEEKNQEEQEDQKRKQEFPQKFPRTNKIPLVRNIVRWIYKEGWWYSATIISIFLFGFVLHVLVANWSKGYVYFHSGEGMFYSAIKEFSSGNFGAIYQRPQAIIVYALGAVDYLFGGKLSIFWLRLIISIPTLLINFYILANLRKIRFLKISKLATLYILAGFTFSYTILFYSSLIRPDIIILTLFNLFLYEYLRNGTKRLLYLICLSALAASFKGNGILMVVTLIALLNVDLVRSSIYQKTIAFRKFLYGNIITVSLTYLSFLLLSPTHLADGVFGFLSIVGKGAEKFGAGHYGLFATGQDLIPMYTERMVNFLIFFSPLIALYFIGVILGLYKILSSTLLHPKKFITSANIGTLRTTLIILLSIVFFLFIFTKPIQFYRYYFPLLTVFLAIFSIVLVKIKPRIISIVLLLLFLTYNSYFIYDQLHNTRLNIDFSIYTPLYRDANARPWQYPPNLYIKGRVDSIDELSTGDYLLVTEHYKYIFDRIISNPAIFRKGDFYGYEEEVVARNLQFYKQLNELTLVEKTGENKMYGYYLPYDVWYMTNPNYYIYLKE
ncbi:MAG: hypothetical protein WDA06_01050 [Phenylobacterium sp.]